MGNYHFIRVETKYKQKLEALVDFKEKMSENKDYFV